MIIFLGTLSALNSSKLYVLISQDCLFQCVLRRSFYLFLSGGRRCRKTCTRLIVNCTYVGVLLPSNLHERLHHSFSLLSLTSLASKCFLARSKKVYARTVRMAYAKRSITFVRVRTLGFLVRSRLLHFLRSQNTLITHGITNRLLYNIYTKSKTCKY